MAKKLIFILLGAGGLILSLFFLGNNFKPVSALTTAETSSKVKTEVFHILQQVGTIASGSGTTTNFTIFVGEASPVASSSYIEISGVTKAVGAQNITVDIKQDSESFPTARARTFTIDSTGKDSAFSILYIGDDKTGNELTSYLKGIITAPSPYTFTIKVDISGAAVSLLNGKLVLTYGYTPPSTGATVPNSARTIFNILQNRDILTSGSSTSTDVTIFVGESSPVIKNAYIEVDGVSKAIGAQDITVDIKQSTDSFPTARARTFRMDSSGADTPFHITYHGNDQTGNDLTSYLAGIITTPTSYTFTVKIDISGASVSLLQARLVLIYQFTQTGGGLPATGDLISPTFDTYTINGANYNWIKWIGTQPASTRVRLQIATSDSSSGPFTFYGETGGSCGTGLYYEPASGTPAEVKFCNTTFNNKRYFRYKVQLCSASDCSSSGNDTPQVDDVNVNWSP